MVWLTSSAILFSLVWMSDQAQMLAGAVLEAARSRLVGLLSTTAILVFLFILRFLFLRMIFRTVESPLLQRSWRRNSLYGSVMLAVLLILPSWLASLKELAAFLALFGAGVLIVMKEVIMNISGWFYIIIRRPFIVGNRISLKNITGDIVDIRLTNFSLLEVNPLEKGGQSTGRIVTVPNSVLFTEPVANGSKEFLFNWDEISFKLARIGDLEKAEAILRSISANDIEEISQRDDRIRYASDKHAIVFKRLTPGVFVEVINGRVQMTLRYLSEPRKVRQNRHTLWKHLIQEFNRTGIDLAEN
jgi:small-conductance mechanosensitive channel